MTQGSAGRGVEAAAPMELRGGTYKHLCRHKRSLITLKLGKEAG